MRVFPDKISKPLVSFVALREERSAARTSQRSAETSYAPITLTVSSGTESGEGSEDGDNRSLCAKLLLCETEAINAIVLLGAFLAHSFPSFFIFVFVEFPELRSSVRNLDT